ncbi:MAG: hypothetical protein CXT71_07915 [Methanobacteriota archaeon]|nr:MAG: hypothetical protein CXT71_07915 [Euryarchaeota archaeon]
MHSGEITYNQGLSAGTYTVSVVYSYDNNGYVIKEWSGSLTVADLGIVDNSTMSLITENGTGNNQIAYANFTIDYQDLDEWYKVKWNLTDVNGTIVDFDDFGWLSISTSYSKDLVLTNLNLSYYCVEAVLYVGTDYQQDSTQSCFEMNTTVVPTDSDSDGVNDGDDLCPNTPLGEVVDINGCSQSQLDDDGDGVMNNLDLCPNTPAGESVDTDGCSQSQLDDDGDGVMNNVDLCPNTPAGNSVDSDGCSQQQLDDTDYDGVINNDDLCPNTREQDQGLVDSDGCAPSQLDGDNDGVMDDADQCPNTPPGVTVDSTGCASSTNDDDGDGVVDLYDLCPNTVLSAVVDQNGCSNAQLDSDGDGVMDNVDQCPSTPAGESVDTDGCSIAQLDSDNDGVDDSIDQCPSTPAGELVDANGCGESQLDSDHDSVTDDNDLCPGTAVGKVVDNNGCADNQRDSDYDGILDSDDQCPNEFGTQADGCPEETIPICDIYYSIKSDGIVTAGDAALSSVSGGMGILQIPAGEYYIVAHCYDDNMVNVTITSPLGVHTESGSSVKVGALIVIEEDMSNSVPVSLAWDDGENSYQANFVVELNSPSSSGAIIPGFTMISAIGAILAVALLKKNRKD